MEPDGEGFVYPVIDAAACTRCHLCETTCPVLHPPLPRHPLAVYAAINTDAPIRAQSSSGGLFTLLARQVLAQGGVVYGAGWSGDFSVVHKPAEDEAALAGLRSSKYAQSDLGDTFRQVRQHLLDGRTALFSGTPCQIAGLRAFLAGTGSADRAAWRNLVCVDLICYAVPSPKVFAAYKREREARAGAPANRISFRDKREGWKQYALALSFANGTGYRAARTDDPFLQGFVKQLYNRPSCGACSFRELRSGADITLGDFWDVRQRLPDMDDDQGTSLVLANTPDGEALVRTVLAQPGANAPRWRESDYADVRVANWALDRSPVPHKNRRAFFEKLDPGAVIRLIQRMLRPSLSRRWRSAWRRLRGRFASLPGARERTHL
jgi:coenzyme F420-reducing hydrogenase beta subunit